MKAIRTRYSGPTNTRGSRYTATDGDGNRVSLAANCALDSDANHKRVAQALMDKMQWPNELVGGGFENDMYWTMLPIVRGESPVFVQFAENGNIRKWDHKAFDHSVAYKASAIVTLARAIQTN